jgi:hypothetical protein
LGQANESRGLVEKLATSNPPATIRGRAGHQRASWTKLDAKEATRVDQVLKQVIQQSEELWAELAEHLDDEQYCKTVGIDAGYPRNWSVGDVCQHIIGQTLSEPFYRHLGGTKENYHHFRIPAFAKDKAKLREWCLARKDRKLYELQIEACQWAIDELESPDSDSVAAIKKEIETLRNTKLAVPCPCAF